MPGAAGQLKALYNQILNGTAPSSAASSSGDIAAMVKYLIANPGSTPQNRWALPGRFRAPIDYTTPGSESLTERISYFKNLTVAAGHTLTAVAGGTILIVEEKLTIGAASILSANALGGKGAPAVTNGVATGGYGGGCWGAGSTTALTVTQGQLLSSGAISATNPYVRQRLQPLMAAGGAGKNQGAGAGANGSAYPVASRGMFGNTTVELAQWELILALMELMLENPIDDGTIGAIGGGGGGAGGSGTAAGTGGAASSVGCRGGSSSAGGGSGAGGSGFGGGGSGGAASGASGAAGGAGGRGGGVLIVICREIDNGGTISANGAAGGVGADAFVGEGGGGGGGAVCVAYEHVSGSGVGTVQANGGTGSSGTGIDGGTGGAGVAKTFDIRSGA